jgi:hypothetical protein
MAYPYRLYGGATRADALNFNPAFNEALQALYVNAPPEVQGELGLTSGYRSKAVQQGLWDNSDKTGHSVARPGTSKHEFGAAADLYGFGLGDGPKVSDLTKEYVKANAQKFGLYFPMNHEPWHIQLVDGAPAAVQSDSQPGSQPGSQAEPLVHPTQEPFQFIQQMRSYPTAFDSKPREELAFKGEVADINKLTDLLKPKRAQKSEEILRRIRDY